MFRRLAAGARHASILATPTRRAGVISAGARREWRKPAHRRACDAPVWRHRRAGTSLGVLRTADSADGRSQAGNRSEASPTTLEGVVVSSMWTARRKLSSTYRDRQGVETCVHVHGHRRVGVRGTPRGQDTPHLEGSGDESGTGGAFSYSIAVSATAHPVRVQSSKRLMSDEAAWVSRVDRRRLQAHLLWCAGKRPRRAIERDRGDDSGGECAGTAPEWLRASARHTFVTSASEDGVTGHLASSTTRLAADVLVGCRCRVIEIRRSRRLCSRISRSVRRSGSGAG